MGSAKGRLDLVTGRSGRLFVLLIGASIAVRAGRFVLAPLLPTIIEDLAITPVQAGFALSVMGLLAALSRYPGGRLADDLSRKTILVSSLLALTAGYLVFAGQTVYLAFLVAAAIVGIGDGMFVPAKIALFSKLYPDRQGQVLGINNAADNLGGIAGAGIGVVVLAIALWRGAFVPVAGVLLLSAVLLHFWSEEPYVVGRVRLEAVATARRLFHRPGIPQMLLAAVLFSFTSAALRTFLPTFLQVEKGFSPSLASGAFASLFVIGLATTPVVGSLGDRVGHARVTTLTAVVGGVGLVALLVASTTIPVLAGVAVLGVGLAGFWPVMNAYVVERFPESSTAGDFGALGTVYSGVGSLGPTYVGYVAQQRDYGVAFAGLLACIALTAAITRRI